MTWWIGFANPAIAACHDGGAVSDVLGADDALVDAWRSLDQAAVVEAEAGLAHQLVCLREPLTPPSLVRTAQALGLSAFLAGDLATARAHFRAALAAQPGSRLPADVAGPGDAWYEMYEALRPLPVEPTEPLLPPERGFLLVDGARTLQRPVGRTWAFQQVDDAGNVIWTQLVTPAQPVPAYPTRALPVAPVAQEPVVAAVAPLADLEPAEVPVGRKRSPGLVIGGVASGLLGGLCLGGAAWTQSRFEQTPPDQPTSGLETANVALGSAGYVGLVGGAGLLGAAVVTRW